jgi:GLPGLI family protein
MKRILVLAGILVSLAAAQIVFAQPEGVITYETKVNLHRTLPPGQEDRKAIIPEFRTTKQQLFFNSNESLFKPLIEDEEEQGGHGGAQLVIRIPNNETYINQATGDAISKNEFFGKDYLILDTVKVKPWKFGTETKDIQGYACKQAFYTDETGPRKLDVTAWYTDKIRTTLGPERFGSLPGTVLAVDINNGERVVVARKVELRPLKKNEMKAPTSGQKMTTAEYRKMVDEQMKKMGGSGGMIIRN